MRYAHYTKTTSAEYPICILVNQIRKDEIKKAYLDPFGINEENVLILDLHRTPGKKKTPVKEMKQYLEEEIKPVLEDFNCQYVLVADGDYFKTFTKSSKADAMAGYVVDSVFGDYKSIYVANYQRIFHNPDETKAKILLSMTAFKDYVSGNYVPPGSDIIHFQEYPKTPIEIAAWLEKLLAMKCPLTVDIEGWGLNPFRAGIATITFCWNQHEGISFPVDYSDNPSWVRSLLRDFFERMEYPLIYHHVAYDVTVLTYQLFMQHVLDTKGLLHGLKIMLKNWEDTRLITYLATNSCAGNKLGLKDQAQEFAGNYALENINDITKVPLDKLLTYNLVDGLSTWYVYNKHWQTMVDDDQLNFYRTIFKPAMMDIIQMQLTGLPVDMDRVYEVKEILQIDNDKAVADMMANPLMDEYVYILNEKWAIKKNEKLKVKRVTAAEGKETFNPNSNPQLAGFLYEHLGLPVINLTDSGEPSCDGDTIKALKNHTTDPVALDFLDALERYSAVSKILTSFIPAFEQARQGIDGWHYLLGNFNLGGTKSGRLSSSEPNLQNLPSSGTKYAYLIKTIFKAPPGWLFCGIDFASLEDRISALTTRDPEKLKVYTDGYDGHSLRAYAYFGEFMPDIDPNSVESINSIASKYKHFRQDSKAPTFALTYQGTFKTLMNNCGFSLEKAKLVETRYHIMYKVSDDWVSERLDEASKNGYVTGAFGLRLRTPLLKQVIRGLRATPYEAEAEGRTAGNALGQSWCLLNTRAGTEFLAKVRASPYAEKIRPCAQIHDAQYFLIRDDVKIIKYANDNVVQACEWQDDPLIYHDTVKLGGEFGIFYPDWSSECTLPNWASETQIEETVSDYWDKLAKKAA